MGHKNLYSQGQITGGAPTRIVIHYTGSSGSTSSDRSALAAVNTFISGTNWSSTNPNARTGAHYCLGETVCYQLFEHTQAATHAGDKNNDKNSYNNTSIGIETGEIWSSNNPKFTAQTEANLVELVNYLMSTYNISKDNVVRHYDVTGKSCPAMWAGSDNAGWTAFKNKLTGSSGGTTEQTNVSSWVSLVKNVKAAIAAQQPGYSQSNYINITLNGVTKSVRTDCSGFVAACLKFFGVLPDATNIHTGVMIDENGPMATTGFKYRKFTSWEDLAEGDIIVRRDVAADKGHTEIFARIDNGKHYVYNCGSNESVNNSSATISGYSTYDCVWSPGSNGSWNKTTTTTGKSAEGMTKLQALASSMIRDDSNHSKLISGLSDIYQTIGTKYKGTTTSGNPQNSGGDGSLVFTSNEKTNCKKIYDQLKANGFSHNGAVAICANIKGESSFNPECSGDSGTSYGLCQWHNERKTSMLNHNSGHPTNSIEHQISYLTQDMKNYGLYDKFSKNDESIENLISSMVYDFEKPADKEGAVTKRSGYIDDVLDAVDSGSGGRGASILPYKTKVAIASMTPAITKRLKQNGRGTSISNKSALDVTKSALQNKSALKSLGGSGYGRGDGDSDTFSVGEGSLLTSTSNTPRMRSSSEAAKKLGGFTTEEKLLAALEVMVTLLTDIKETNQEISEKNFTPVVAVPQSSGSPGMALGGTSSKVSLVDSIISGI